ncbi:MAG: DUF2070 family protein [Candidatus Bathyarchaeota archaeon]|nr:DUF2070 family protein [Candidatus Bathyarchaeota archaeon]
MASTKSLEYSIERAIKHYSQLFVLPSYRRIVSLTFLSCVIGSVLTIFLLARAPIVLALQFSLLLFLLSTISDLIIRQVFMKSDMVYNTRRCAALSMFSILLWFSFLIVGSSLTLLFDSWSFWVDLFSIGFAAVCILRLIVFSSISFVSYWRAVGSSLMHPIICLLPMYYVSSSAGYTFGTTSVAYLLVSIPISILTAFLLISLVNKIGTETIQIPTTSVLKAFLANWMENVKIPLEGLFENFGGEKTIDFSLLAFEAENRVKSVITVSSFHPGPFRNVGSSSLPFLIQEALEKKLGGVAAVPHGLFGHEFDLASQRQNQKVLRGILDSTDFTNFGSKATRFVRTQKGVAGASCQIFGDCAVVTLTLAPETTEDFPRELGDFILEEASKLGLAHVIIINAHNSINGPFDVSRVMVPLKKAALDVLKRAFKLKSSLFEVGAAKVVPEEFSFEDGMGSGGICALVIRVDEQTCAYITIDGNNMVSGLRRKILDALKELGVDEGEVLTTDTHVVNAIGVTERGYCPLGEAIPHERLINYVKRAVREALSNMKPASADWRVGKVLHVRVIGEKQIKEISLLADKALQRAKKTAVPLFAAAGLLLITLAIIL